MKRWAVAARSDTLWAPWALVAMTAVALWSQSQPGGWSEIFAFGRGRSSVPTLLGIPTVVLTTWLLASGISALMSSWQVLDAWMGQRRWAFRLAATLTLVIISSHSSAALMGTERTGLGTYLAGVAGLVAIGVWLVLSPRRDIFLIAATALAVNTSLVFGFARMIFPLTRSAEWGDLMLVGLVAAGLIAASVVGIMRLVPDARTIDSTGLAIARREVDAARPWPVVLLSGFGAIFAAVPFISALVVILGPALQKGPVTYIVALIAVPIAMYFIRRSSGMFTEQLALVGLASGMLLLLWGIFRDLPTGTAGLLSGAIAIGLAFALGKAWLAALLGAAATAGFAVAFDAAMMAFKMGRGSGVLAIEWSVLAVSGVVLVEAWRQNGDRLRTVVFRLSGQEVSGHEVVGAMLSGWLAASLAGLAIVSGSAFLFAAHVGPRGGFGVAAAGEWIVLARIISGALAGAACMWMWSAVPSLRSRLAAAIMATAIALSLVMPALGAVLVVLALAISTRMRVVALAAVGAALWIIGAFYYNLSLPLTHKSAILAACGAVVGIAALFCGARLSGRGVARSDAGDSGVAALPFAPSFVRTLAIAGLAVVGVVSTDAIRGKEALILNGAPVFVELAPVDPRSLMQGDYMALRFQLPNAALRELPISEVRPRGIGKRDGNGVLRLSRVGTIATPLAEDEMMIELVRKDGRWIVVTDGWFFKEGTAGKWEAARYGEFRVLPDGRALLVGLTDKERVAIK